MLLTIVPIYFLIFFSNLVEVFDDNSCDLAQDFMVYGMATYNKDIVTYSSYYLENHYFFTMIVFQTSVILIAIRFRHIVWSRLFIPIYKQNLNNNYFPTKDGMEFNVVNYFFKNFFYFHYCIDITKRLLNKLRNRNRK